MSVDSIRSIIDNDPVKRLNKILFLILVMTTACGDPLSILGANPWNDAHDAAGLFPPEGFSGPGELSIEQVDPNEGPIEGGTRLHITGTGFVTGTIVLLGQSTGIEPVIENKNSLSVTTPPHNPGVVDVRLVTPDNRLAVLSNGFTYKPRIAITKVIPGKLPLEGGIPITVRGSGFDKSCILFVGGRRSPKTNIISSSRITAIAPDNNPGPASVVASCELGEGHLRNAVEYVAPATIDGCSPVKVMRGKKACVVVYGTGMTGIVSARLDNMDVPVKNAAENQAVLCFDSSKMPFGKHGVTLITPGGNATRKGCFVLDDGSAAPGIIAVIPDRGPVNQEQRAVVILNEPQKYSTSPAIMFGDRAANILKWDPTQEKSVVNTPVSTQSGAVDVIARWQGGEYRLPDGYTYYEQPVISRITPASGPVAGNTSVDLIGTGLGQVDECRFGPLPGILQSVGPEKVVVTTPRGAPGPATIRIHTADGQTLKLGAAFSFFDHGIALNTIYPSSGAICGGGHVHVYGAGFTSDTKFFFGENRAMPVSGDAVTPSMASLKLPPGIAGPVDVTAKWPNKKTLVKHGGFVYFDPASYFGGTWGEPIEHAVNVVVKDRDHGKRIPNAFVLIGSRVQNGIQGYTDENGMLTLWDEKLRGPIEITAAKKGFSTASLVGVDAENITLFLESHTTTSGGGSTSGKQVPDGVITGHVTGITKGILAPPGDCAAAVLDQQPQCLPCQPAKGCGNDEFTCADALGTGWYCLKKCSVNADCPTGYSCYSIKYQLAACMPQHGTPTVKCYPSPRSGGWSASDPGPGFMVRPDGSFGVSTRPGDIAVYCVGGFLDSNGRFKPLAMGVVRHVSVLPGQVVTNVDIPLNIPMNRTIRIKIKDLPSTKDQPLIDKLGYYLDLGSDGAIQLWPDITATRQDVFAMTGLPEALTGPLADSKLVISFNADYTDGYWDNCSAYATLDAYPNGASLYFQTKDGFLPDEDAWNLDIQAACPDGTGNVLLFSRRGLMFVFNPKDQGIETAPFPYGPRVLGCVSRRGSPLAAAESGVFWSYQNNAWHQVPTGTSVDLSAIATGGMGTFAVGDNIMVDYNNGNPKPIVPSEPVIFNTVTVANDYVLAAGNGGRTFLYKGGSLTPVLPAPTNLDLFASCTCNGISFLAGANGIVLKYDGTGFKPLASGMHGMITTVTCNGTGGIWAASDQGEVRSIPMSDHAATPMRITSHGFYPTAIPLTTPLTIMGMSRASMGPMVWIPRFDVPAPYSAWSGNDLQWQWPGGPLPDFVRFMFTSPKGVTLWSILIRGDILDLTLPILKPAIGFDPLEGENPVQLSILGAISTNFNINAFDQASIFSTHWISWSQKSMYLYRRP